MKRIVVLFSILLTALAVAHWAQQPATAQGAKVVYYDTFSNKWLDPAKWLTSGPGCAQWLTLECVREIQGGQLRLEVRNLGATDSDYRSQFSESEVWFVNPNAITSITADVTVRHFSGIACSSNNTANTFAIAKIDGGFFNTGSGDPADDVSFEVNFYVDPSNPKTVLVGNWMTGSGLGVGNSLGRYPIGTPLTGTVTWDKANRRFISTVMVTGDNSSKKTVAVPYSVNDAMPPAYPVKYLPLMIFSANCTSAQTFAQAEVFYDNVKINQ